MTRLIEAFALLVCIAALVALCGCTSAKYCADLCKPTGVLLFHVGDGQCICNPPCTAPANSGGQR